MPVRVATGFEFGTAAGFTTGVAGNRLFDLGASPTISVSTPRTGSYCLELSPTASTEWVGWDTSTFGTNQSRVCLNMWIRFPSALPAADVFLAVIEQSTNFFGLQFRNSDDKLVIIPGSGGTAVPGPTVVADTWYHVEIYVNSSANPWTCDWWVDTAAQTQATLGAALASTSRIFLGDDVNQTMVCRYDDLVLWTDTADIAGVPFGKHKVVRLIPDTGGTAVEIGTANATGRMVTNSAIDATFNSANILAALSEVPPTLGATASGIGQRTSSTTSACGIPMTTYTLGAGESFTGLRIIECGWASGTTVNAQGLRTFNGTTENILFAAGDINADTSTTPAWLCKMAVAGSFDTQAEVDALVVRWGYSGDISPLPGAHAIYGELAVKEAVAAAATAPPVSRRPFIKRGLALRR